MTGMRADCLPECRFVPWAEVSKGWPEVPSDWDPEWAKQAGVVDHHEDCPVLARHIARGQELAERLGWK